MRPEMEPIMTLLISQATEGLKPQEETRGWAWGALGVGAFLSGDILCLVLGVLCSRDLAQGHNRHQPGAPAALPPPQVSKQWPHSGKPLVSVSGSSQVIVRFSSMWAMPPTSCATH